MTDEQIALARHAVVRIYFMPRYSGYWSLLKVPDDKLGEGPTQEDAVLSAFKALQKS